MNGFEWALMIVTFYEKTPKLQKMYTSDYFK